METPDVTPEQMGGQRNGTPKRSRLYLPGA